MVDNDFFVAKCGFASSVLIREGEAKPHMFHDPGPLHDATPKRRELTAGGPEHAVTIDLIPDPFSEEELQGESPPPYCYYAAAYQFAVIIVC